VESISGKVTVLEILKRAKSGGELVSAFSDDKEFHDEVNRRTFKAGYTTRSGECPCSTKIQTTCGFGKERLNVWPRDKHGNLIQ
jgi:hypothetical protein